MSLEDEIRSDIWIVADNYTRYPNTEVGSNLRSMYYKYLTYTAEIKETFGNLDEIQ